MGITAIPWNITQKKKHGNVTILGNSQPNSQLRGVHSEFRSNMAIEIGKIGTIIPRKSLKIRETCRCLRGSIWCFFPCTYFTLRWSDPRKMLGLVAAFRTAGRQLWQLTVQLLQRTVFLVLDFHLDNDWGNDWVNQFNGYQFNGYQWMALEGYYMLLPQSRCWISSFWSWKHQQTMHFFKSGDSKWSTWWWWSQRPLDEQKLVCKLT